MIESMYDVRRFDTLMGYISRRVEANTRIDGPACSIEAQEGVRVKQDYRSISERRLHMYTCSGDMQQRVAGSRPRKLRRAMVK